MNKNRPTLAIYGIQDRGEQDYPLYVHDHNLTLMENGQILTYLHLERISRQKRDNKLYISLKTLLKEKKLIPGDYDLLFVDNVAGRTFLTRDGEARFEAPLNQSLVCGYEKGRCWWFGSEKEAYSVSHELAHIFSCLPFVGNFRDNSLLVHFDGGASLSNFSAALYKNNSFRWLEYNWRLKNYSSIYNANALVFAIIGAKLKNQNSVPGKFMGFAGWGNYNYEIEKWLVKNDYFMNIWGKTSIFIKQVKKDFGIQIEAIDQKNPFIQDVAATLQNIFIKKIIKELERLAVATNASNLYYTGGSALNISANTQIIKRAIFKNVFIPPCTDDSGLSTGAAAYAEWKKHGSVNIHSPFLNNWGIENYNVNYSISTVKEIAEIIMQGKIVGICNGFGECGPRALGNRSLIALAGSASLAKDLSMNKKGREWYRPLAPIALKKNIEYFTGEKEIHLLSKYMLIDFPVLKNKKPELAGAIHADGTTRFQTIYNKKDNPFMYDLLEYMDKIYGIKALINTSFNAHEEPMVHTVKDALTTAKKLMITCVVLNGEIYYISEY